MALQSWHLVSMLYPHKYHKHFLLRNTFIYLYKKIY